MLSMEGEYVFGLECGQDLDQFVAAGVAGDVDHGPGGIDDIRAGPEELVNDPEDGGFIAWDRSGRNDYRIAGTDRDLAVVAIGNPTENGHGFALAAGNDIDDLVVGEKRGLFRID